ncbi:LysR family transcriptional regulator [Gallaecimonas kandeliae]|uniref:LysR family transcriptional regulator n=1 Tax=Gallaecimonas kandeliae TaxID=3029055 RepID=UPI00264A3E7F|nr:LysR family transcriptional regulator [Gallaecimonas kandeliae]WKE65206.1 LysR family transcriptional regulator [Gallaecimonas kandeliae]
MDIKALRYFHQVASTGSFTAAAQQLGVAQPAVSMAVRKLEDELGLRLFHRQDRQVQLTDEGRRLLPHAERILKALLDAEREMEELKGLGTGEVRVGIPSMLGSYHFPPILMAFRHRYPNLNLSVIEGGTWELQQMLEAGDLDLAVIASEFLPEELEARVFLTEEMLVTVPKDHPFAAQPSVDIQDFFDQELVMFQEGYFHRKVMDRLAREAGREPKVVFQTNLIPLIKSIVRHGFGISTLLRMAVADEPELVSVPFAQPLWLELSIAWRKDSYLSKANSAFVDFLLEAS